MFRFLIISILFCFANKTCSQTFEGLTGLIQIPTSRIQEDGILTFGSGYIPKPFFYRNNSIGINPGVTTYVNYVIHPRLELVFRYTHELNVPVNTTTKYFPDRMASFKLKIFEERKIFPSTSIGINDFSYFLGTNATNNNSSYHFSFVTFSKLLELNEILFDFSLGSGFDLIKNKKRNVDGLFYGIGLIYNNMSILIENNSKNYNIGFKINLKNLNLNLFALDFSKLGFGINYSIK